MVPPARQAPAVVAAEAEELLRPPPPKDRDLTSCWQAMDLPKETSQRPRQPEHGATSGSDVRAPVTNATLQVQ
jgi:hypothetical protein